MPSPGRPPGVVNPGKILRYLPHTITSLLALGVGGESVLQRQSPHENEHDVAHTIEATTLVDVPAIDRQRRNTVAVNQHKYIKESAITALAPANSAVAAPSSRRSNTSGLASPQIARNLEDWEVEDFVLLATVDGKLHAQDRKSGKERWVINADNHAVQSTHYGHNYSSVEEHYHPTTIDDYIWAIEPTHDGNIYIYRRNGLHGNLADTKLSMRSIVEELMPYEDQEPAVTYTGEKKTTLVVIDARTGEIVKYFGSPGPMIKEQTCLNTNGLSRADAECKTSPTFTIGRREYTVMIIATEDSRLIAKLQFSEWVPNNYDHDLQQQYHTTLDNTYIYTTANGGVYGVDHSAEIPGSEGKKMFKSQLSSPVVRIFDVARPWGTEKDDPGLIVLPQPMPPLSDEDVVTAEDRLRSVFLDRTDDGSWFALSGKYYPTAVQGVPRAKVEEQGWQPHRGWQDLKDEQSSQALVGLHSIEYSRSDPLLTIGTSTSTGNQSMGLEISPQPAPSIVLSGVLLIYNSVAQFFTNPLSILLIATAIMYNFKVICVAIGRFFKQKDAKYKADREKERPLEADIPAKGSSPIVKEEGIEQTPSPPTTTPEDPNEKGEKVNGEVEAKPRAATKSRANSLEVPSDESPGAEGEPKKKKRSRGARGGVKHKKGAARARSTSQDDASQDPKGQHTVEEVVHIAKELGERSKLEPDLRHEKQNPAEISEPIIRVGDLVVNTEKLIGTGSNGTMVFEGEFDGRKVAVKRMLIQFFDIASQETKLLKESDDHPNVIRYYAQQQAAGFLYIALELCPASLADIIAKPMEHKELVQSGEKDLPHVLYQIANGLAHLHDLRIVHRDLKPQNILISRGKDGKPRLLVSDFGLCKKLEDGSFFGATTAHAAGTMGWRAPELLLDDDAKVDPLMNDASTNGDSGTPSGAGRRVASRAIDIFSLGLVFFYVLTKGDHPYNDGGGHWMREFNIRKGNLNLDPLDVLGDYAFEAKDLIRAMLSENPRQRPSAIEVMSHPFFWSTKKRLAFLCDVSDHFEKECRDPPSPALQELERWAPHVCRGDFLKQLPRDFVDSLGKQRKYTGTKMLDLLRALRNKKNHYEDMSDKLKQSVGPLPDGYLFFWTGKFTNLLITCWNVVYEVNWNEQDRFRDYYQPGGTN